MPRTLGDDEVMIKVVLDRQLRDQFKGQCALNGTNMNAVLHEFISIYVKNQGQVEIRGEQASS